MGRERQRRDEAELIRLGLRLRQLRTEAGMTQDDLAGKINVQREAIARWELGKREPGWFNIQALANALGLDCTAFNLPPGEPAPELPEPKRGRPATPKDEPQEATPPRKRGRPKTGGGG